MSTKCRVLILGPTGRVGVAIARSLHSAGVGSVIGLIGDREPALNSRAIDGFVHFPQDVSSEKFVSVLTDLSTWSVDMIMPCSDAALRAIANHEEQIRSRYRVTCPPAGIITRVLDKDTTLSIASSCGIPIPQSFEINSLEQFDSLDSTLRYPVIAKPRTHEARRDFVIKYFHSSGSLRSAISNDPSFGARNVIQEYAPGGGVGIAMLIHEAKPIAAFQHRRLKEMPASGGASVLAESEQLDPVLAGAALKLLRALSWTGIAMVEFRRDESDGSWVLMEVNGRYWGSLPAALLAGVDFPRYDWELAHGILPEVPNAYRTGVRMRWMAGDLDRMLGVLLRLPADSPNHPSRSAEIFRFISDFNGKTKSALWAFSDPAPALFDVAHYARSICRTAVRRLAMRLLGTDRLERWHQARILGRSGAFHYFWMQTMRVFGIGPRFVDRVIPASRSILFVCKGNIFRSAFCEAYTKRKIEDRCVAALNVESAGLAAVPGDPANPLALAVGNEMGIQLGEHVARPVTREMVALADVVFVMDYLNAADFVTRFGDAKQKMFLVGTSDRDSLSEIADPDGKGIDAVRACFSSLAKRLDTLLR